jgi:hypothetical protein
MALAAARENDQNGALKPFPLAAPNPHSAFHSSLSIHDCGRSGPFICKVHSGKGLSRRDVACLIGLFELRGRFRKLGAPF